MILRNASAAGVYYPRDKLSLEQTVRNVSRRIRTTKRTVLGALAPHSGIFYCGDAQAYTYKSVTGSPIFVILGANHRQDGSPYSIMTQGVWATPLGRINIDSELAAAIAAKAPRLTNDIQAFTQEHSIETQLPWIQGLVGRTEFVPISIYGTELEAYREIGSAIRDAAHETGRAICVVASSDLTRYGESFRFVPVEGDANAVLTWMKETDASVLDSISKLDVQALLNAASKTNVCGLGAIITMLYACMEVASGGTVLNYGTSYPVTQSLNSVTGYASLVLE